MEITREQLAKALDHLWVFAANREGTHHGQIVEVGPASRDLWENLLARDRPEAGDAKPEPVVDAHICCEHAGDAPGPFSDPELAAMAAVLRALERLRPDECSRVLDWARRRFAVEPPF